MIYINMNDESRKMGVEIKGSQGTIMADLCTVMLEICQTGEIDPEEFINEIRDGFLEGCKDIYEEEGDESAYVKDERSKETIQSISRRARRRLH